MFNNVLKLFLNSVILLIFLVYLMQVVKNVVPKNLFSFTPISWSSK